jgi:hypothetical protein
MTRATPPRRGRSSASPFVGRFAEQQMFCEEIALERGASVEWAREDPDFIFIRDDPRYQALVELDD